MSLSPTPEARSSSMNIPRMVDLPHLRIPVSTLMKSVSLPALSFDRYLSRGILGHSVPLFFDIW